MWTKSHKNISFQATSQWLDFVLPAMLTSPCLSGPVLNLKSFPKADRLSTFSSWHFRWKGWFALLADKIAHVISTYQNGWSLYTCLSGLSDEIAVTLHGVFRRLGASCLICANLIQKQFQRWKIKMKTNRKTVVASLGGNHRRFLTWHRKWLWWAALANLVQEQNWEVQPLFGATKPEGLKVVQINFATHGHSHKLVKYDSNCCNYDRCVLKWGGNTNRLFP